jgi:VWFA-related protein
MQRNTIAVLLAILVSGLAPALAQEAAPPPASTTVDFRSGAEEVLLDIIVRDKKGKELRDIDPGEIEVWDNGVKRDVRAMRLVEGREAIQKGSRVPLDPMRQIRLVTLVFEPLGVDGRRLARQAALDLVKQPAQNVYFSVLTIIQQMHVVQQFTNDQALLKKAIEKATSGLEAQQFAAGTEAIRNQLRNEIGSSMMGQGLTERAAAAAVTPTIAPAQGSASTPADAGTKMMNAKFAQIMLQILDSGETVNREESGRMSILSLLSIARAQSLLPGRKSVLYFSEGIYIPPHLESAWQEVIAAANRSNVSFYAIDARGLSMEGDVRGAVDELMRAAGDSRNQMTSSTGASNVEEFRAAERAENSMRSNRQGGLAALSESTGGFLIANTNDFRNPIRRINEEINTYYELAYNPGIEKYDASFRRILVKVTRPDVRIQARSGYFALPPGEGGKNVSPFEIPLLTALQSQTMPQDVNFRSTALHLEPAAGGEGRTAVLVEVPMAGVQFTPDAASGTHKGRIGVLALLKDSTGAVVKKWSREQPVQPATAQLEGVKAGNFLYKELTAVPPGKYSLEVAVIDREANRAGARKTELVVEDKKGGVGISNIVFIRRYEPKVLNLDPADPFQFQGGRVTPTLNSSLKGGQGAMLAMFFTVYPDKAMADKPTIRIEYLKDGQVVGHGELELPPADAQGRIPYIMSSSAEAMPPGAYEIRATAKQGNSTAEERAFLTIE